MLMIGLTFLVTLSSALCFLGVRASSFSINARSGLALSSKSVWRKVSGLIGNHSNILNYYFPRRRLPFQTFLTLIMHWNLISVRELCISTTTSTMPSTLQRRRTWLRERIWRMRMSWRSFAGLTRKIKFCLTMLLNLSTMSSIGM